MLYQRLEKESKQYERIRINSLPKKIMGRNTM